MTAALTMPPESRAAMIQRWEREGRLDPNCPGCREFYESPGLPSDVWAPGHKASSGCESGKRAHCTCDLCFTVLLSLAFSTAMLEALHASGIS